MQVYSLFWTNIKSILKAPARKHSPEFRNTESEWLGYVGGQTEKEYPEHQRITLSEHTLLGENADKVAWPSICTVIRLITVMKQKLFSIRKKKINLWLQEDSNDIKKQHFFVYLFSLSWIVLSLLGIAFTLSSNHYLNYLYILTISHNAMILTFPWGRSCYNITLIISTFSPTDN